MHLKENTGEAVAAALPDDPFLEQFFSRLPKKMRTDFTDRQLAALKSVFGDATRSGHGFDIRLNLPTPLFGRGVYVVFLGGRDRRGRRTGRHFTLLSGWRSFTAIGKLVIGTLFVIQLLVAAVALVFWLF